MRHDGGIKFHQTSHSWWFCILCIQFAKYSSGQRIIEPYKANTDRQMIRIYDSGIPSFSGGTKLAAAMWLGNGATTLSCAKLKRNYFNM